MKYIRKAGILLFWLAVWFAAGRIVENSLVLVGPEEVFMALGRLLPSSAFWKTVWCSLGHIVSGFLAGFLAGMLLGGAAYRFPFFRELISPVISLMKAVPVASFVILALIFMGSKNLALLIVFLLVIPIVYYNTLSGFQSTDRDLLEMAQVFRIPTGKRLTGIYRPALRPFLVSAALEIRCGGGSHRCFRRVDRRAALSVEDLSGDGGSVCLDDYDYCTQYALREGFYRDSEDALREKPGI